MKKKGEKASPRGREKERLLDLQAASKWRRRSGGGERLIVSSLSYPPALLLDQQPTPFGASRRPLIGSVLGSSESGRL